MLHATPPQATGRRGSTATAHRNGEVAGAMMVVVSKREISLCMQTRHGSSCIKQERIYRRRDTSGERTARPERGGDQTDDDATRSRLRDRAPYVGGRGAQPAQAKMVRCPAAGAHDGVHSVMGPNAVPMSFTSCWALLMDRIG
jgi:hypothetical protein